MIIKCDKCATRFRMADEKIKPEGTKVRCAKCRHIFPVFPPQPAFVPPVIEEAPPAPEAEEQHPEPAAQSVAASETAAESASQPFEAGEDLADQEPSADRPEEDFSFEDFAFGEGIPSSPPGPEDDEDFGLGDFDFSREADGEETPLISEEPQGRMAADYQESEEPTLGSGEEEQDDNWGDFSLQDEEPEESPSLPSVEEKDAPSDQDELEDALSDFTFADEEEEFDFSPDDLSPGLADAQDEEDLEDEEPPHRLEPLTTGDDSTTLAAAATGAKVAGSSGETETQPYEKDLDQAVQAEPEVPLTAPPTTAVTEEKAKPPASKSPVATLMIFILVVLIILTAITGYLFWQKGPRAFEQLILGLAGGHSPAVSAREGIELSALEGRFVANQEAGELFVIHGQAANRFAEPRSAIQLKGVVYGGDGRPILQQTVFGGNPLTDEQLRTLPYTRIEEAMNNQFGETLSNLNVRPDRAIPFTIVFRNLPPGMSEFTVEVVDSRPPSVDQ